ncbi:heavy-metal-associated domain-containing protein [Nocardiopsis synnemataformans]|uniref:heavy-metal-associated domain-containing protein n=1 Tax=Nocardiopsis synnemataformans TaxID=61305 RepID=UPI003EBD54BC
METVVLRVQGMSCQGCASRIERVLERVEGVRAVAADHTSGRVQIRLDPASTEYGLLVERIRTAGFEVVEGAHR